MTKKHFQEMATAFGAVLRNIDPTLTVLEYDRTNSAIWDTIDAFMRVAAQTNANFDRQRFIDWVTDTQHGRRNLAGKKVA